MSLLGFESVRQWLDGVKPGTGGKYFWQFGAWLGWLEDQGGVLAGLTPDGLVEFQRKHKDYQILDAIQDYLKDNGGPRHRSKNWTLSALRSFFLHNRAELPRDGHFKVRAQLPPVEGRLRVEDARNIIFGSNPLYQAVFACMVMGGMGEAEVVYWSNTQWPSLKRQLDEDAGLIRVELPGRKRNRNIKTFWTLLGRDAKERLHHWVDERPPKAKAIFTNQYGAPVSERAIYNYWMRHLLKLGIIRRPPGADQSTRYGKNTHKLRGIFRSRWRVSGADVEVAEFFMGHDIDKLGYDHSPEDEPWWFEEQYIRAEPWLNVMSEDPERVPIREHLQVKRAFEKDLTALRERLKQIEEILDQPGWKDLKD